MRFVVTESTYAVFDPLGGVAGERVTSSACDAFRLGVGARDDVTTALLRANAAVQLAVDADVTLRCAGCTAGALSIQSSQATVAWAGMCTCFDFTPGSSAALTRVHSMVNDDLAAGRVFASNLSPSERKQLAGVLVRGLGMMRDLNVETRTSRVEPGDVFALLSDALFDALGERLLSSLLSEHQEDLQAGVRALLDTGMTNGGRGTLTVVLVATDAPEPAATVAALSAIA